jgi:hypothetical protein
MVEKHDKIELYIVSICEECAEIIESLEPVITPSKNYHSESCCNCFFERKPREMTKHDKSTFSLTAFLTERVVYRWNFCKENASFANLYTSSITNLMDSCLVLRDVVMSKTCSSSNHLGSLQSTMSRAYMFSKIVFLFEYDQFYGQLSVFS